MTTLRGLFVAGVAALAFTHARPAHAAESKKAGGEVVSVGRCGASFRPPQNWFVNDPKKIEANVRRLADELEDVAAVLSSHRGSIEIASYAKHDPRGHSGLIPTINVLGRANPHKSFGPFTEMIRASSTAIGATLRNYVITTDVTERTIAGQRVLFFVAEFDLTMNNVGSFRVSSTTYAIPCGEMFLQVSMSESMPAKHGHVFASFIDPFSFKQP